MSSFRRCAGGNPTLAHHQYVVFQGFDVPTVACRWRSIRWGVIERVRTGEKEPSTSLEAIGHVIGRTMPAEGGPPRPRGGPIVEVNRSSRRRRSP